MARDYFDETKIKKKKKKDEGASQRVSSPSASNKQAPAKKSAASTIGSREYSANQQRQVTPTYRKTGASQRVQPKNNENSETDRPLDH